MNAKNSLSPAIEALIDIVKDLEEQEEPFDLVDFHHAAIAGERLCRYSFGEESKDSVVEETIALYLLMLKRMRDLPEDIEQGTDFICEQLRGITRDDLPDTEWAWELLLKLDEMLCKAFALSRSNQMKIEQVAAMATRIDQTVLPISRRLPDLWERAAERDLLFGRHPDDPVLFGFWRHFVDWAPSKIALEAAFHTVPEWKRQRDIARVLERIDSARRQKRRSYNGRVREWFDNIEWPTLLVREPILAFAGEGQDNMPALVGEYERFAILDDSSSRRLLFKFPSDHAVTFEAVVDGVAATVEQLPKQQSDPWNRFVFGYDHRTPPATVVFVVTIDGERIELNPITVK